MNARMNTAKADADDRILIKIHQSSIQIARRSGSYMLASVHCTRTALRRDPPNGGTTGSGQNILSPQSFPRRISNCSRKSNSGCLGRRNDVSFSDCGSAGFHSTKAPEVISYPRLDSPIAADLLKPLPTSEQPSKRRSRQ